MIMNELKCPNCGASITVDREREFCFCSYCGTKIMLQNENEVIYTDKARIKESADNKEIELKKMEIQNEQQRRAMYMLIGMTLICLLLLFIDKLF